MLAQGVDVDEYFWLDAGNNSSLSSITPAAVRSAVIK